MNTEDRPLHTPVPSSDEVWEISYYCHYHYYAQINSKLQHLTEQPTRRAHFTVVLALGGGGGFQPYLGGMGHLNQMCRFFPA